MTDSYQDVPIAANGDYIDASYINDYLGGNFRAMMPFTTNGDLGYWNNTAQAMARLGLTSGGLLYGGASAPAWLPLVANGLLVGGASAPAWLAAGTNGKHLEMSGGAPAWLDPNFIHAIDSVSTSNTQNTSSTIKSNITNALITLTVTRACRVFLFGAAVGFVGGDGSYACLFDVTIGGVAGNNFKCYSTFAVSTPVWGYQDVSAGSIACRVRWASSTAGVTAYAWGVNMMALAVPIP